MWIAIRFSSYNSFLHDGKFFLFAFYRKPIKGVSFYTHVIRFYVKAGHFYVGGSSFLYKYMIRLFGISIFSSNFGV